MSVADELEAIRRCYRESLVQIDAHDACVDAKVGELVPEPYREELLLELANLRHDRKMFREQRDGSEAHYRTFSKMYEECRSELLQARQEYYALKGKLDLIRQAIRVVTE